VAKPRSNQQERLEVLAIYAATGNASEAARKTNVPERTAQTWVSQAIENNDPVLADLGAKLRARALDAATRMLASAVELAHSRAHDEAWCERFKGDPGPAYIKAIVDARKALAIESATAEAADKPVSVTINVKRLEDVADGSPESAD